MTNEQHNSPADRDRRTGRRLRRYTIFGSGVLFGALATRRLYRTRLIVGRRTRRIIGRLPASRKH